MNNIILYTTQDKKTRVELYEFSDSVYLNQESLAKLFLKKPCFDTSKQNISLHIKNILEEVGGGARNFSFKGILDNCK